MAKPVESIVSMDRAIISVFIMLMEVRPEIMRRMGLNSEADMVAHMVRLWNISDNDLINDETRSRWTFDRAEVEHPALYRVLRVMFGTGSPPRLARDLQRSLTRLQKRDLET